MHADILSFLLIFNLNKDCLMVFKDVCWEENLWEERQFLMAL
jgi:hypothetical protein